MRSSWILGTRNDVSGAFRAAPSMLMSCDMRMGGDAVGRSAVVRARRSPLWPDDAGRKRTSAVLEVVGRPSPSGMAIDSGGNGLAAASSSDLLPASVPANA